jgi:hypothetical protein
MPEQNVMERRRRRLLNASCSKFGQFVFAAVEKFFIVLTAYLENNTKASNHPSIQTIHPIHHILWTNITVAEHGFVSHFWKE